MMETLNKMKVQNIAVLFILLICGAIAVISMYHPPTEASERITRSFYDIGLMGCLAWLFNKTSNTKKEE